jgi:hypothetical protein
VPKETETLYTVSKTHMVKQGFIDAQGHLWSLAVNHWSVTATAAFTNFTFPNIQHQALRTSSR